MERREPEIRSFFHKLEGNYLVVTKVNAIKVASLKEGITIPLPFSKPVRISQCASIHSYYPPICNLRCIVELHLDDVVYIAQMFAKLVFAIERDFLAIASVNMTLEFRLESWGQMARFKMAIKVIHTAASNWATRHQADEAGRLG